MSLIFHSIEMLDGGLPQRSDKIIAGSFPNVPYGLGTGGVVPSALPAITAAGSGYTSIETMTITPVGGTGSGLLLIPTALKCVAATVAQSPALSPVPYAGTGYAVSDTITMPNGVVLTVSSVGVVNGSPGGVTGITVTTPGSVGTTVASNPVSPVSTSGSGVGALFNLSFGLASITLVNSGVYTAMPTGLIVSDTGGGTGATLAAPAAGTGGATTYVGFKIGNAVPSNYGVFTSATTTQTSGLTIQTVSKGTQYLIISVTGATVAGTLDILLFG